MGMRLDVCLAAMMPATVAVLDDGTLLGLEVAVLEGGDEFRIHGDAASGGGGARRGGFVADVDHAGMSLGV